MSENIPVTLNVDDSQVDAAIAKLDLALERSNRAFNQAPLLKEPLHSTGKVQRLAHSALDGEGLKLSGLEQSAKRIVNMIPGLREAQRLNRSLGQLASGNIVGVVGVLMLALSVYRLIMSALEEQKRQQETFKREIMRAQNFSSNAQFQVWQVQQQVALESYRNRPTIR